MYFFCPSSVQAVELVSKFVKLFLAMARGCLDLANGIPRGFQQNCTNVKIFGTNIAKNRAHWEAPV